MKFWQRLELTKWNNKLCIEAKFGLKLILKENSFQILKKFVIRIFTKLMICTELAKCESVIKIWITQINSSIYRKKYKFCKL